MLELALRDHWPVERKRTLGMHLFETLMGVGFLCWSAWLLWWRV
jgi:hypothetical protein